MTKKEYSSAVKEVIYLSSCAIEGEVPDRDRINRMNLEHLYRAAGRHQMTAITSYALESAGVYDKPFIQAKAKAIRKLGLMDADMKVLFENMEHAGIWYMPLKGSVIKDYYPAYGMRQMSDHDILFDVEHAEEVKSILEGMGYISEKFGSGNHDCYFKEPVCNFEMHRALFGKAHELIFQEYYSDVKSRLVKDEDNDFGYHFTPEDFYIYLIAHEYKHYEAGGTGIRSLLDTYVYLKKQQLDMDYISGEIDRLGITDFEKTNRALALHLFSGEVLANGEKLSTGEKLSDEEREMLNYIIFSGTYGTVSHRIENVMKKNGWGKLRYLLSRFLVPVSKKNKKYEVFATYYPVFYKHKILLPLLPFYRILRGLKNGRLISETRTVMRL